MADLIKTFDLNKPIKSKTYKLTQGSENKITFENDIAGQVVYKELNNKIAIEVYETKKIENSYTKTKNYYNITDSDKCTVTSTKYVWTKVNAVDYGWKPENTRSYVINKSALPAFVTQAKPYQVEYVMTSKGDNTESSLTSTAILAADQLDTRDALYKERFIDKFGLVSKTLTENVEATIYIDKGDVASEMIIQSDIITTPLDLLTQSYAPQRKGNKYTGMYLNEIVTSSEANETFDLKTGDDEVNFAFADGVGKVGSDVINLAKDEILTLRMMNSTDNTDTADPDANAEFLVNTSYTKKGNDLVMKYTNNFDEVLGQTTIKNYFKIAQDNITLKYSGARSEVVDYDYSLKEYLEWQDGIGILGNEDAKTAQKITGNFLDNIIYGGSGNDTIKGVMGYNFIIGGKGDDKLYCGNDTDSFFIYEGDATGSKGDKIYNADKDDSIYFLVQSGDVYVEGPTYFAETTDPGEPPVTHAPTFEFTKNGNSLVVVYNKENVYAPGKDKEKVTFVDYFKKNSELFNINDAGDYSKVTINQTAKGTVKGTDYNDDIYLKGKSTVYTGDGNDTIRFYNVLGTGATYTTPVEANVTTNINGVGTKTFERIEGYGENAGDMGNKTIVFQNENSKTATANLNLLGKGTPGETAPASDGYIYSKSGNNLVIEGYYSGQEGYVYNPDNEVNVYDSYGSYTIKDYFKDSNYVGTVNLDGNELDLVGEVVYQEGKKGKASKFEDSVYDDYIIGANKNDKYYFTEGGNDRARDIKGNDTYNVASLANTLSITDMAGTKDKLVISDTTAHSLYFDITMNGTSLAGVGKDLQIFDKTKIDEYGIAGGVTIKDYIADYTAGGTVTTGAGCIETIKVGGNTLSIDLNSVAGAVAGWLAYKGYTSTSSVFTDYKSDIEAMLNVYTTGEYTPPTP